MNQSIFDYAKEEHMIPTMRYQWIEIFLQNLLQMNPSNEFIWFCN
jgi:hypothetical protein